MAIMANDACGAPIPFEICLPTFFDGKLFHFKLRRAAAAQNLMELCDGRVEMARQVKICIESCFNIVFFLQITTLVT